MEFSALAELRSSKPAMKLCCKVNNFIAPQNSTMISTLPNTFLINHHARESRRFDAFSERDKPYRYRRAAVGSVKGSA